MTLFRITANAEFVAEGIDDAFAKLAYHFMTLHQCDPHDSQLLVGGSITVEPMGEYNP